MLLAERGHYALALASSAPWVARSAGFVSASDGWQELHANKRLLRNYMSTENGNVALTGEIDLDVLLAGSGPVGGDRLPHLHRTTPRSPGRRQDVVVERVLKAKGAGLVSGRGPKQQRGASFALLEGPWRGSRHRGEEGEIRHATHRCSFNRIRRRDGVRTVRTCSRDAGRAAREILWVEG